MSIKPSKPLMTTFAALLVTASVAFAQQSPSTGTGSADRPGTGTSGQQMQRQPMGSPGTGMTSPQTGSQMGTTGMQEAIPATVAEVNQQQKTVRLRLQNGETVQMKVPDQLLTSLNQGDSVQVSIRKMQSQ
jgi:hypothetical protein